MLPDKSSLDDCNISKILAICHKETQTKKTILKDSGSSTDSQQCRSDTLIKVDKSCLKQFEFNQIIKDSENSNSITVIRDSFIEETRDHSDESKSPTDDAVANRYKYCREVIKPYLKSYPQDCPDLEEKLIQDTLKSIQDDLPDYQPCIEVTDDSKNIKNKEGSLSIISDSQVDACTSCTPRSSCTKTPSGSSQINRTLKSSKSPNTCDKQKPICTPKSSYTNRTKCLSKNCVLQKTNSTSETIMNCDNKNSKNEDTKNCPSLQEKHRCKKKDNTCPPPIDSCSERETSKHDLPAVSCSKSDHTPKCKDKILIQCCEEKPSKTKIASSSSYSCNIESEESPCSKTCKPCSSHSTLGMRKGILDSHGETITTIKVAAEDFFGQVYKMTKDAVAVTKESTRQLCKITTKKSESNNNADPPTNTKVNDNSETLPDSQETRECEEYTEEFKKTRDVLQNLVTKVDSTISVISDQIHTVTNSILKIKNFNDNSSPYDKPASPKEISHNSNLQETASIPSNVFNVIKSKLCSMFCENEKPENSLSRTSSTISTDSNISKKETDMNPLEGYKE
ncbi:uncharacterized protein LOC131843092 [Achroia grisella]|uniref:uncharacterized protein LOC131843092 n=1 Tax=Achroia grisella TaxID=688607 RepID=UPI0027D1F3D2|nr:uncharacterized protein LOC131843092 [Achroia grisella]